MVDRSSRRTFLVLGTAAASAVCSRTIAGQEAGETVAASDCRRCGGAGLVPLTAPKPLVWLEGQGDFKPEEAIVAQPCPICRAGGDRAAIFRADLVEQTRADHAAALGQHAEWELRFGEELLLVLTRYAAIHTQLKPADAKRVGQALENLAIQLQKVSGSIALTPTRSADYQQVLLWGEDSWTAFRQLMQSLYTPEQLGDNWHTAGKGTMYDHVSVPHCYFTPKIVRDVPPEFFAVKLAATRQIFLATDWKAPAWLAEGFAAYGQQAVLREARVSTIYALGRGPTKAVTLDEARRQSAAGSFRPWEKLLARELRDFEPADYFQSLSMVAFLLETEPTKFLTLADQLKTSTGCQAALENAYGKPSTALEAACAKWLARRG